MTFDIPKDYQAPEGVTEGKEFQEIATFKFDGKKMTLVGLGEDNVPLAKDKAAPEAKPKPKGAKEAISDALKSGDSEQEM